MLPQGEVDVPRSQSLSLAASSSFRSFNQFSWTAVAGEVIVRGLHSERKRWRERGSLEARARSARFLEEVERKKMVSRLVVREREKKNFFFLFSFYVFRDHFLFFLYTTRERGGLSNPIRVLYKTAEQ